MSESEELSRRSFLLGRLRRFRAEAPPGLDEALDATPSTPIMRYPQSADDLHTSRVANPRRQRQRWVPLLRPPGAVDEVTFLEHCTRCGDCAEVCPEKAVVPAAERFGAAAGTPVIDQHAAACVMCDDTPCITACAPGVLTAAIPLRMGTARIDPQVCLAYQGSFCTTCGERCPVPGAITITQGRPSIDQEVCTGCGVCAYVCPAPQNAVGILPTLMRPQVAIERRPSHESE